MASEAKRPRGNRVGESINFELKDLENDTPGLFLKWFCDNDKNFLSEKVTVRREGSCAQNGMVALQDIKEGECLFKVSRQILLQPDTSSISDLFDKDPLDSKSGWPELLLAMMHEYNQKTSKWKPYFNVLPKEVDLPMFWTDTERVELLSGTGVIEAVDRDLKNIKDEFLRVVSPYIKKHSDVLSPKCDSLELYMRMVSYVMAYSFTEPPKEDDESSDSRDVKSAVYMVPMADMLNHVAKNNAKLSFKEDCLEMNCTKPIEKGEEVFNTYGELANWHLLHMYGFTEKYPNNHFDTVDLPIDTIVEAAIKSSDDKVLMQKKGSFLKEKMLDELGEIFLGAEGVVTDDALLQVMKLIDMSTAEFTIHQEQCEDGWLEDEEDSCDLSEFEKMKRISQSWKAILSKTASLCMLKYKTSMDEDEEKLQIVDSLTSREKYALFLCHGQKKLFQKLINTCK